MTYDLLRYTATIGGKNNAGHRTTEFSDKIIGCKNHTKRANPDEHWIFHFRGRNLYRFPTLGFGHFGIKNPAKLNDNVGLGLMFSFPAPFWGKVEGVDKWKAVIARK
jgi:hypothetical protein